MKIQRRSLLLATPLLALGTGSRAQGPTYDEKQLAQYLAWVQFVEGQRAELVTTRVGRFQQVLLNWQTAQPEPGDGDQVAALRATLNRYKNDLTLSRRRMKVPVPDDVAPFDRAYLAGAGAEFDLTLALADAFQRGDFPRFSRTAGSRKPAELARPFGDAAALLARLYRTRDYPREKQVEIAPSGEPAFLDRLQRTLPRP